MAKKRTTTNKLKFGSEPLDAEQIDNTIKEVAPVKETPKDQPKEPERIKFTTTLTPSNRAYLEAARVDKGIKAADTINRLLEEHFRNTPKNSEYKHYLKVYTRKLRK